MLYAERVSGQSMRCLLVNFGGPRSLDEIEPFLRELLTDPDVIKSRLSGPIYRWFFGRLAAKRARKIAPDYELIGGKSPIFFDTETIAKTLGALTFHRYLPATHSMALEAIEEAAAKGPLVVLPMFPQFSYATTGSIARFFWDKLSARSVEQLHWIRSYPDHPLFINAYAHQIRLFLQSHSIAETDVALLCSAHGIPINFVRQGDPYVTECKRSFNALMRQFPGAVGHLSFQSKFGPEEWTQPYTDEACERSHEWRQNRPVVAIVPLSFTSDHIETLFEIEQLYLPLLQKEGSKAVRCPCLNLAPQWLDALAQLAYEPSVSNASLLS
ncbi:MAG: ferrochelatase, partial [Chlamydiota bacterium]